MNKSQRRALLLAAPKCSCGNQAPLDGDTCRACADKTDSPGAWLTPQDIETALNRCGLGNTTEETTEYLNQELFDRRTRYDQR